jgi:hypothetical protein
MLTNLGAIALLNAQASYLATCHWGLYTDDDDVTLLTVLTDLTEAGWGGYARQLVGAMQAAFLNGNQAQAPPVNLPVFTNSSGALVTFSGWMLIDPTGLILLDGGLFAVQQSIPDGAQYTLVPAVSDRDASL